MLSFKEFLENSLDEAVEYYIKQNGADFEVFETTRPVPVFIAGTQKDAEKWASRSGKLVKAPK